jgi:hypothetical protein
MSKEKNGTAIVKFDPGLYPVLASKEAANKALEVVRENVGQITPFDFTRIKIPAGGGLAFNAPTIDDADATTKEFTGIIIHQHDARGFWPIPFDESPGQPPQCTSNDGRNGHGDPGGPCFDCPNAQFGSDKKERGQACNAMKIVYMLPAGQALPVRFVLPATSIKTTRQYLMRLASASLSYFEVVTAVTLETASNAEGLKYSRAKFNMVERLPEEQVAALSAYRASFIELIAGSQAIVTDDAHG